MPALLSVLSQPLMSFPPTLGAVFMAIRRRRFFLSLVLLLAGIICFLMIFQQWEEVWHIDRVPEDHLSQDDWHQGALVHFTDINAFPTMLPDFRATLPEERAVVTALFTDTYAHPVAVLGHSLQKVGLNARKIALYIPNQVSEAALCIITSQGWDAIPVERIPPPHEGHKIHPRLIDQYTKLQLWSLDKIGIRSLIYLDADTLVLRPIPTTLFDLPFAFAAVPDGIHTPLINGGMMVIKPDSRVHADLIYKMETSQFNLEWAEQNFLNLYFGAQALRLPWLFNANVWIKMASPNLWEAMKEELVVIHYTSAKPIPNIQSELLLTWEEMERAIYWQIESQPDWEEELIWWQRQWVSMRDGSFEDLLMCVPLRNETGSAERLSAAGLRLRH
ncbi:nucleotide-diphospho-sugar transferase [Flagelloscypha sp. PMI_526]|nr:nucleotide-diphospho-sugar transferase [Flagelloscypha sp. PMI_526]